MKEIIKSKQRADVYTLSVAHVIKFVDFIFLFQNVI